jgi:hypothetical protein
MPHDLPEGLLQALLLPLIDEFLSILGNDKDAAWEAAEAAVMSFNPETTNEFLLAARVAHYNILGNRLSASASASGLTPACAIRMHRCALAYIKEADKAEICLRQLQADRMATETQQPTTQQPTTHEPIPEPTKKPAPESVSAPAGEPAPHTARPQPEIPAYKRLKLERRLARQHARNARLGTPDLPLAA